MTAIKCSGPVWSDCVELYGEWVFRMRQGMDGKRKASTSGKAVAVEWDSSLSLASEAWHDNRCSSQQPAVMTKSLCQVSSLLLGPGSSHYCQGFHRLQYNLNTNFITNSEHPIECFCLPPVAELWRPSTKRFLFTWKVATFSPPTSTLPLQELVVVNNVIRFYRGNFPVPFIRSLVIMQPVRNQFELLKFQLTATLCRGAWGGRGGRGELQVRERKQVPHWALLSLARVSRARLLTSTSEPQTRLAAPASSLVLV